MKGNPDYYAALGITPQAAAGEVARAYRTMMRARHPDTSTSADPATAPPAGTAPDVQAVMDAYSVLKDPVRRAAYDRQHKATPSETGPTSSRQETSRFPQGPPLIVGPLRWHRIPDRAPTPDATPAPAPAPARNVPWRSRPFLAVVLPTRARPPPETRKGRTGRTEQ